MNYLLNKFLEILAQYGVDKYLGIAIYSILPFALITAGIVVCVLILVLAERKILAYFQQRKGPNRVGYWGILQTVADAIKLLCKENIELINSNKFLFTLSPIVAFSSITVLWCIIPYNSEFKMINSSVSLLIYLFISSFPMLFHFLAGYSSKNKYGLIGSYRALGLTLSYSIPMAFSLLSVVCLANSMDLNTIIDAQLNGWIIFPNAVGFVIFYISAIAKLNRTPFDLSEAESELVCGYHTEYSGMRFAMFFLGEYAELFVMSLLTVILFFGGYLSPFGDYLSSTLLGNCCYSNYFIYFEQTFWLILKTSVVIFSIFLIRATLPRLTQNQTLNIFWKYLTPISMINLILMIYIGEIIR